MKVGLHDERQEKLSSATSWSARASAERPTTQTAESFGETPL
jgi:hypothetical protein